MRHLEIIHLRSSAAPPAVLGARIRDSIRAEESTPEVVELYRRTTLETDLAVHLRHAEGPATGPSALGQRIAAALKAYGLVEHTLWEELR